jgi:hypothetical protein
MVGPVQVVFKAFTEKVAVIFVFVVGALNEGIFDVPLLPIEKEG